jgi:hypothetical protein
LLLIIERQKTTLAVKTFSYKLILYKIFFYFSIVLENFTEKYLFSIQITKNIATLFKKQKTG